MRHGNVVMFFGAGYDPTGNPFLVVELMERGSLKDVLRVRVCVCVCVCVCGCVCVCVCVCVS